METPGGRGLADRLLGLAFTMFIVAVLFVVAVHLIESIWPKILIVSGVAGGLGIIGVIAWRRWENRYR